MKIKQQVVLTAEEAMAILKKVVENKTKQVVKDFKLPDAAKGITFEFVLEDASLDVQPAAATPAK